MGSISTKEVPRLAEGLRRSRDSWHKVGEKNRLLQEKLLRLEKRLWGRQADETVKT